MLLSRHRQLEFLCRFYVDEGVEHLQQFRQVLELGEAVLHLERVAAGYGHLHFRTHLPECCCPGVEIIDAGILEEVRAPVSLHHVHFGDAVGDYVPVEAGDAEGRASRRDPFVESAVLVVVMISSRPASLTKEGEDVPAFSLRRPCRLHCPLPDHYGADSGRAPKSCGSSALVTLECPFSPQCRARYPEEPAAPPFPEALICK